MRESVVFFVNSVFLDHGRHSGASGTDFQDKFGLLWLFCACGCVCARVHVLFSARQVGQVLLSMK